MDTESRLTVARGEEVEVGRNGWSKVKRKKARNKKIQWKLYNIKNGMIFRSYKKDKNNTRCSGYSETGEILHD